MVAKEIAEDCPWVGRVSGDQASFRKNNSLKDTSGPVQHSVKQLVKAEPTSAIFKRRSWRAVLAVCVLAIAACKATPPAAPLAPVEDAPRRAGDEPSNSLPPDLYKTMPVYPGAKVEHVRKPKGAMREIVFSTDAQLNPMVAYYKEELKKNNFHVTSTLIMPARKTWSCDFHIDGRPGSITMFPSDNDKSRMTIDLIYELPANIDTSLLEPKEDFDAVGPGDIAQQGQNPNPSVKAKRN